MKIPATITSILLICAVNIAAHQDRILAINDSGRFVGVPPEFGPARIKLGYTITPDCCGAKTLDTAVNSITLHIGKNATELPECIAGRIHSRNYKAIQVTASWNHDEKIVPYYLNITFCDNDLNGTRCASSGYRMMFNMRTGKLMEFSIQASKSENVMQSDPIDIQKACLNTDVSKFYSE